MGIFDSFDQQVNLDQLKTDMQEAIKNGGAYAETPAGEYFGKVEKLEVGTTKDGRPMLKLQFRISDGDQKNRCVFMNRVLYGTKNDANMIASAVGFLESLCPSEDITVDFQGYSQFADLVLDVHEDIASCIYKIDYDPDAFNTIHIIECTDG